MRIQTRIQATQAKERGWMLLAQVLYSQNTRISCFTLRQKKLFLTKRIHNALLEGNKRVQTLPLQ